MSNTRKGVQKVPIGHATINGAGQWLNRDRGTIRRIVADNGLVPVAIGKYEYYRLADIVEVMLQGDRLELQQERARLAIKQTEKIQLFLDEESGKLVRADDVKEEWCKYIAGSRAHFLILPTKLAPACFAAGSIAEVEALLKKQVWQALDEIARTRGHFPKDDPEGGE